VRVILRRFIANALKLAATNAHDWHPDFVMKLRTTSHLHLTPALGQQVFLLALQHRDQTDFLKFGCEAGFDRMDRPGSGAGDDLPFPTGVERKLSASDRLSS
jgi:hypothetical protein